MRPGAKRWGGCPLAASKPQSGGVEAPLRWGCPPIACKCTEIPFKCRVPASGYAVSGHVNSRQERELPSAGRPPQSRDMWRPHQTLWVRLGAHRVSAHPCWLCGDGEPCQMCGTRRVFPAMVRREGGNQMAASDLSAGAMTSAELESGRRDPRRRASATRQAIWQAPPRRSRSAHHSAPPATGLRPPGAQPGKLVADPGRRPGDDGKWTKGIRHRCGPLGDGPPTPLSDACSRDQHGLRCALSGPGSRGPGAAERQHGALRTARVRPASILARGGTGPCVSQAGPWRKASHAARPSGPADTRIRASGRTTFPQARSRVRRARRSSRSIAVPTSAQCSRPCCCA